MENFTEPKHKIKLLVNHQIGDLVYLKTDPEQLDRLVTGYIVRPNDILYELSHDSKASNHYHFEITIEKKP